MRTIARFAFALLLLFVLAAPASAAPLYERIGVYRAASGVSYFSDACATGAFLPYRDNVDSDCVEMTRDLTGSMLSVRDEGLASFATQRLRVCFYTEARTQIVCPDTYTGCAEGYAYCARVPAGAKYFGVSSATGVDVQWRAVAY